MKRTDQRSRQFSATRLSYSRQKIDQTNSRSNLSPSNLRNHDSKSLLCNNCFNRQLSSDRKIVKKPKADQDDKSGNTSWAFYENAGNQKLKQAYKEEVRKVNEYNVQKIRQNQLKQELEKQEVNQNVLTQRPFQQDASNVRHKVEEIRLKLREDLQKQIATAKEKRIQARRQLLEAVPSSIFEQKQQIHRKQQLQQQYKRTLMEQIREQKIKKQKQTQSRKYISDKQNNLSFVKDSHEKKANLDKLHNQNKQQLMQELKRKKQLQVVKKENQLKAKEEEYRVRLQEEQRSREQSKRNEELRRANIQHYLQDLRQQIQLNQINRREEFNRLHTENVASNSLIPASSSNLCSRKMQNCSCCTKVFPKQYLSPYSRMQA